MTLIHDRGSSLNFNLKLTKLMVTTSGGVEVDRVRTISVSATQKRAVYVLRNSGLSICGVLKCGGVVEGERGIECDFKGELFVAGFGRVGCERVVAGRI